MKKDKQNILKKQDPKIQRCVDYLSNRIFHIKLKDTDNTFHFYKNEDDIKQHASKQVIKDEIDLIFIDIKSFNYIGTNFLHCNAYIKGHLLNSLGSGEQIDGYFKKFIKTYFELSVPILVYTDYLKSRYKQKKYEKKFLVNKPYRNFFGTKSYSSKI